MWTKNWRRWESNPRPKWIKINLYVCRYQFSRLTQESIRTWQVNPRFYLRETLNPWRLSWCTYRQLVHCVLHNGPIKSASWTLWVARISDYAAKAWALEKSALITLLAFNLFCPLITENSSRTRNLFSPKHPVKSKTSPWIVVGTFVPVVPKLCLVLLWFSAYLPT